MTDDARSRWATRTGCPGSRRSRRTRSGGGPSVVKLIAAIVIGLVAIGVDRRRPLLARQSRPAQAATARSSPRPRATTRSSPTDPGGMNVAGEGDTAFAASEGAAAQGQAQHQRRPRSAGDAAPAPARRAAHRPGPRRPPRRPRPRARGRRRDHPARRLLEPGRRQPRLDRACPAASAIWRRSAIRSCRSQVGGRTLYRLRASGPDAAGVCRRLQVAGEACTIVN